MTAYPQTWSLHTVNVRVFSYPTLVTFLSSSSREIVSPMTQSPLWNYQRNSPNVFILWIGVMSLAAYALVCWGYESVSSLWLHGFLNLMSDLPTADQITQVCLAVQFLLETPPRQAIQILPHLLAIVDYFSSTDTLSSSERPHVPINFVPISTFLEYLFKTDIRQLPGPLALIKPFIETRLTYSETVITNAEDADPTDLEGVET